MFLDEEVAIDDLRYKNIRFDKCRAYSPKLIYINLPRLLTVLR
jgi:hypothetical protein